MTDSIKRVSTRQRVALAIWGVNIALCLVLLVFVLR